MEEISVIPCQTESAHLGEGNQNPQWLPWRLRCKRTPQSAFPSTFPDQALWLKQISFGLQTPFTHYSQPPALSDAKQRSQELLWTVPKDHLGEASYTSPEWYAGWRWLGNSIPSSGQRISNTYMTFVIHLIVGEFQAIKADDLPHPGLSRAGRVRVNIEPGSDAWVVCISSYHPLWAVVHIPKKAQSVALGTMGQSQVHGRKAAGSSPNGIGQGLPVNPKGN